MKRYAKRESKKHIVLVRSGIMLLVLVICAALYFGISDNVKNLLAEQRELRIANQFYELECYEAAAEAYASIESYADYAEKFADVVKKTESANTEEFTAKAEVTGITYTWYVKDPGSDEWVVSSITSPDYSCKMTAKKSGRQVYCVITDENGNQITTEITSLIYEGEK